MSEINENVKVQEVLDRIKNLNEARSLVEQKKNELITHEKDLDAARIVKGENSDEYRIKYEVVELTKKEIEDAENKVKELSFKRSELKSVFEEVAKKFENELRSEQEREFYVEIGPEVFTKKENENGEEETIFNEVNQKAGARAFRHLLDYLYKDVKWNAKSAAGLLVLVKNMEENKPWVRDKEFNNIIRLRSANVLVLWRSILEDMEGKGFYEAKTFLEVWANCGKGISDAVREIQKKHEEVRNIGTQLNTIEEEYNHSEDDLPKEENEELTIQEEVDPEV